MAVKSDQMTSEDLKLDVVHNFEERGKELCGHFIPIARDTVYLVHQTTKECLLQAHGAQQPEVHISIHKSPQGTWHRYIVLQKAHHEILDICLHYLSLLNVKDAGRLSIAKNLFSDQSARPFLEYAGRYWTVHYLCVAPRLTPSQLDACARLCNSQSLGSGLWFNRGTSSRKTRAMSGGRASCSISRKLLGWTRWFSCWTVCGNPPSQPGVAPPAHGKDGSIAITNSSRLLGLEGVVHPHTISPGHLLESPLSEAVNAGLHPVGANHRRLLKYLTGGNHRTQRYQ